MINDLRDMYQQFPVVYIMRDDLSKLGFTEEQITGLSDEDMKEIARKMQVYMQSDFNTHLEAATRATLREKEEPRQKASQ